KGKSPRKPIREVLFDDVFPYGATSRSSSRNAIEWSDAGFKAASGRRAIRQAHAEECDDTVEFKLRPVVVPHDAAVEVWLYPDPLDVPRSLKLDLSRGRSVTWSRKENGLVREGAKDAPVVPGRWTKVAIPAGEIGLKPGDRIANVTLHQTGGIVHWDALTL